MIEELRESIYLSFQKVTTCYQLAELEFQPTVLSARGNYPFLKGPAHLAGKFFYFYVSILLDSVDRRCDMQNRNDLYSTITWTTENELKLLRAYLCGRRLEACCLSQLFDDSNRSNDKENNRKIRGPNEHLMVKIAQGNQM